MTLHAPSPPVRTILSRLLFILTIIIVPAWLLGRIVTDRFAWSQWLFWIPTPLVIASCVFAMLASLAVRNPAGRKRLLRTSAVGAAVGLVWFTCFEHRFLYSDSPDRSGLHITLWNVGVPLSDRIPEFADELARLGGDITVMNSVSGAPWTPDVLEHFDGAQHAVFWPVVLFTRLPILESRELVRADGMLAALVRVDARAEIGRPITLLIIDLPSNPTRGRMSIASELVTLLRAAGAPDADLVLGDFNLTRGGAAIDRIAPGFTNAYDEGGHGYAATYPRTLPLYHIDHVLLSPGMTCRRYDVLRPALGRHCAVSAFVTLRDDAD